MGACRSALSATAAASGPCAAHLGLASCVEREQLRGLPRMCLQIEVTNSQGEGNWASWQLWNISATLAVSQTRSCRLPAFKTHTQAAATGARPRCRSLGRCALLYDDQVADAISASGVACSGYRVWSHGNTNRLYDVRWAENGLSTRKSGVHSHGDCDGAQK